VLVGYVTKIDENNNTPNYVWIGSGGVIVRNNRVYVLTAQHVTEFVANLKKKLVIGVPKTLFDNGKIVPFETKILVVGHPEGFDMEKSFLDFAILEVLCNYQEIKKYFSCGLTLSRRASFKENDDILLIGNMLADYAELSVSFGRINKVGAEWPKYHIYADYASLPGTSGSPVFDKNGNVVGVHVASLGGRVSLFVDINVIRCEAEKQGYGFLWED
jgi:S1-C subfamily serine protease